MWIRFKANIRCVLETLNSLNIQYKYWNFLNWFNCEFSMKRIAHVLQVICLFQKTEEWVHHCLILLYLSLCPLRWKLRKLCKQKELMRVELHISFKRLRLQYLPSATIVKVTYTFFKNTNKSRIYLGSSVSRTQMCYLQLYNTHSMSQQCYQYMQTNRREQQTSLYRRQYKFG